MRRSVAVLLTLAVGAFAVDIKIANTETCPKNDLPGFSYSTKLREINNGLGMDLEVTFPHDIDNKELYLEIELSMSGKNGYTPLFKAKIDLCEARKGVFRKAWDLISKQIEPNIPACPIPQGTYVGKNIDFDLSKVPLIVGRFKTVLRAIDKGTTIMCEIAEVVIS